MSNKIPAGDPGRAADRGDRRRADGGDRAADGGDRRRIGGGDRGSAGGGAGPAGGAAPQWLTDSEQRAWMGYRRMRTLLDLQLARDLNRDSGLSAPDYDVLSTLSESADSRWRAGDLAQRLSWSTSRLTHHVNRMKARGLVARETCPDDGRGATIFLTDTGWATLREAAPAHVRSVREHFIDLLTSEQIDALAAISATVVAHLTERNDATAAELAG